MRSGTQGRRPDCVNLMSIFGKGRDHFEISLLFCYQGNPFFTHFNVTFVWGEVKLNANVAGKFKG